MQKSVRNVQIVIYFMEGRLIGKQKLKLFMLDKKAMSRYVLITRLIIVRADRQIDSLRMIVDG